MAILTFDFRKSFTQYVIDAVGQNDKGVFWGCNNYPDCRNAVPDKGGVPDFSVREFEAKVKCP
ncbi:hypothetical protein MJM28_27530, partial [Salmonella enterica subsp. enterica serovar Montevideo]|nr:hypothetical protein [Salmonella enterica subsp. enterica serovar Montevideo]